MEDMESSKYVGREEHNEFAARMISENKRLEDENDRQNHRLNILEDSNKQITDLAMSVQDLASSVKSIAKETERLSDMMKENITGMDARLKKLEAADGEKWRSVVGYVGTTILGIVIAYVFHLFGM